MAMLEQLTDDWSECKCGEITTLLSIGKNEFFLSCDLCDYRIQNFDLFIKHVHQNHLDVLVEANSMPASTDFLVQHTDEDVSKWHNLVEETDSKDGVLKGFENVEIDIDEGESEATIHYKVEGLAEEYANEYEDHNMQALSETEYLEEDSCEYAIENIEEDASSSDEAHDIETELQDRFKERRFTLEFLKLYRALPSLWNVKNKLYHNREIKREQYQTLLEKYREMYPNAVLRDVKKRINCLRTNYNKERRMLKRGNKQKLYYYKAISFLQDIEPFYKSKAITHDSDDIEMPVVTSDEESEQFEAVEQLKPNMKRCNAERIHAKRKFFLEFIELYKSFPSLWDSSDPDYKNQELRHINYQILLTKYKERYPDAELLDLKKKINCLRTNYKHELSRAINTGVESKAVCFKAMSFLGNNEYNNLETKEIENDIQNTEMASDEAKDDMITEEYLEDCDISEEKAPVEIEIANTQLNSMQNFKEERKSGRFLKEEEKFVLQFIEMYKIMPALWDPNSPGYLDIETKNIHYKILLEKYKERYPLAVLQDVKKKINILRTNYNKELKQITSGVFKKKKSLYFDALSFLQNNESLEPESNSTEKVLNDVNIVEGLIIEDLTQSEEYLENSSTWEDATSTQTQFKNEKSANNAEIEKIYPGELTNEQKFTLEFIEIYQGLPALWDVNSVDYSDREYKNIQYQILLEKYKERYPHANINDVKKKINCLRTNYRRDIRRGPPYALFYFDKMNFLNGIQISSKYAKDVTQPKKYLETSNIDPRARQGQSKFNLTTQNLTIDRQEIDTQRNLGTNDLDPSAGHGQSKFHLAVQNVVAKKIDRQEIDTKRNLGTNGIDPSAGHGQSKFDLAAQNVVAKKIDRQKIDTQSNLDTNDIDPIATFEQTQVEDKETIEKVKNLDDEQQFLLDFIDVYHKLPALWNIHTKDYYDKLLKDAQYEILHEKYQEKYPNANLDDVKKKINSLRTNYRRDIRNGTPHALYYFHKINFLSDMQIITAPKAPSNLRKDSSLCDDDFIKLAKAYESHQNLWNDNEIQYTFSNRRRETMTKLLENFNKMSALNLTKDVLEKEISLIRKICSREKREQVSCNRENVPYEPTFPLYEHIAFLKNFVSPFACLVCKEVLTGSRKYKIHVASHNGSVPYKCSICEHGFKSLSNLTVHLRRHAQDYIYSCNFCSVTFASTTNLKKHMYTHTGSKLHVCHICGNSYTDTTSLKYHLQRHQQQKYHKCQVCNKAFSTGHRLKMHHKSVHLKTRDVFCDVCHKGFATKKHLRQHKQIHSLIKKYVCKICGKQYAQSPSLSAHMKGSHGVALSAVKRNAL
ncbi:uncharacterized protein [Eurosta solidaginis]|uniref:uncharacterized protein isoform X2 n=1 Tax=Eurosta solidaginis TaxID=178769 RepID=UPI003530C2D0